MIILSILTTIVNHITLKLMPFLKVSSIRYLVSGIRNTKYKILNTKYRKTKGFTLIELLVVIAIIGILASFAIASFTSAQAKGRDSRRKGDLDAIKKALELFKGDTTGSAKYPNTTTGSLVTLGYMRALPTDPSSSATNYNYTAFQANGTSACSGGGDTLALASAGNCETFRLYACLENVNDSQKDAVDGNAADLCTTTGVVSYTVRN